MDELIFVLKNLKKGKASDLELKHFIITFLKYVMLFMVKTR